MAGLLRLVTFDIFEAVDDAPTEFDELRAFARKPPTFQGAGGKVPASGKLDLG